MHFRAGSFVLILAACSSSSSNPDDTDSGTSGPTTDSGVMGSKDSGSSNKDSGVMDSGMVPDDSGSMMDSGPPPALVYGHTADTLYSFDLNAQMVSLIGKFSGCTQTMGLTQVIDLAVDEKGNAFVTTFDGFYSVDLMSAACTLVAKGSYTYPNSLSFVPKGTLDQNQEALVGYNGATYLRIDTSTGAITNIGTLGMGYMSSGDIVSVKGGGTFLTVTGNGCADCVLQVDPKTGSVIQNYGSVGRSAVYGLAWWAGALYGFDEGGDLFRITGGNGTTATTASVQSDAGIKWWGAGSTTDAPLKDPDGGTIPIK